MNHYVRLKTADLYRPNARFIPERQRYQALTPFGKLGYSQIFAVRADDGPVVKRLRHADGKGWRLVSDNTAYKPVPWPQDAVVLGQVMWTGRTL